MATSATTRLRFRLLGPLEVLRDGEPLPLGGERQRGLLALLLLHANELVTTEHLAEQLFGAEGSDASVRAVRVAVSRLRRLLDDETLETGPGGYLARTDPAQLDVAEFEALVAEGRAALAGGDPAAAAASFRSALALFRGPPLADLAALDFVQGELRRLEELRLSAVMDRIDADLALGSGGELVLELEALVQENPFQERLRGQLMWSLYRSGRQADALETYRRTRELLADELGLEPSRALQQLERAMLQHDPALDVGAAAAPVEAATCPFKGLAAFEAADAFYFCGRERLLDEIVTRLASETFLGIVGPSGVGKSSLLRAGILPALASGALPRSAEWRVVLARGGDGATAIVRDAVDECRVADRVVIAIDQLEEIFAEDLPPEERFAFFEVLEAAAADPAKRALVLVAVRADFYGRFADYPRIADRLSQSHIFARSLDREELARAIEIPASRAGLDVERPLVDALVVETAGIAGALPLLQTTLLQLWAARDGRTVRYESYRAIGGLRGAVARLAEETFAQLSPEDRELTRRIMLRLAGGEDGALVRRRVPLADLQRLDGASRVVDALVTARLLTVDDDFLELSHEALLHEWPRYAKWLEDDRVGRHLRVHLAASAEEWDSHGRDSADLYRGARLTAALELPAVELTDRDGEFLDASRAEAERELNEQRSHNRRLRTLLVGAGFLLVAAIVAGVLALVSRSNAQHEAQVALGRQLGAEAVSEPRIDRAMLLARESLNLDRSPQTEGTMLTTLLRTPEVTGAFTVPIQDRPQDVKVSPDGRSIAVVTNNNVMRVYDTGTHRQTGSFGAADAPYAYIPNSGNLLVGNPGFTPTVLLVNPHTGKTLRTFTPSDFWQLHQKAPLEPLLVSPDGRYGFLLYSLLNRNGSYGRAYMEEWRLDHGGPSHPVRLDGSGLLGAAALPGGRVVVAMNGRISTWDARKLKRISTFAGPAFGKPDSVSTAFSPSGRIFAYGLADGTVHFRNIEIGETRPGVGTHAARVQRIAFSPNSRVAVSTGDDGLAILWNPSTGRPIARLSGHVGRVLGVDFSRNGKTLYTAGLDGTVLQYDLGGSRRFGTPFSLRQPTHRPEPRLALPGSPVLAVSPNSRLFAASAVNSTDGTAPSTVVLYSASPLRKVGAIRLPSNRTVGAGAWAGSHFVLGADRGLVQFWNVTSDTTRPGMVLHGLSSKGQVRAIATADGGRVTAAVDGWVVHPETAPGEAGELAIWRDGRLVGGRPMNLHAFGDAVAVSPDGATVAVAPEAGGDPGNVLIVNAITGGVERTILPNNAAGSVEAVAFAPDGTLATGAWSGIVDLWNPKTGKLIGHPTVVAPAPVSSIAFSADGRTFATSGGSSGGTRIWDTSTLQQLGSDFPGGEGLWGSVAYTPDGRSLVAVFGDGKGYSWPVAPRAWENHACAVAARNFTHEEWRRFVGGRSYSTICPGR
jgi:DNA-binding SARP family transcriptional activator/WD40 repeat protein